MNEIPADCPLLVFMRGCKRVSGGAVSARKPGTMLGTVPVPYVARPQNLVPGGKMGRKRGNR